jgi:poly-gamma-glutamate capsule biosynthesis protein CapA/YwtB (metallophosphatase superfamily)
VVVSGSQSHFPQTMTFVEDSFIHYGLGNLFFDQMEPKTIRQAFLDRHYFYDGRYLGVELLTTMLEDHSRPRPMTTTEREKLLRTVFDFSDWGP